MIWVDYAILAVIALSALISVLRGFIRESLSLLGWILAAWVAFTFSADLEGLFAEQISVHSVRMAAAFLILFIATLLLSILVNFLAGQLVDLTGLTGTDRMLGVFFGIARGIVIIAVLVLFAGLTPAPQDPWWRESMLLHHFQSLAIEIRDYLPAELASRISY